MNLVNILKDCPKGTKLYSTILGPVKFEELRNDDLKYPIVVEGPNSKQITLTIEGKYYNNYNGECILFPSKDNRDWSTFKAPKKEYEFKPFDRILVRDSKDQIWSISLFSHKENNRMVTIDHVWWNYCIPYKGNEHLLGTSNNPD